MNRNRRSRYAIFLVALLGVWIAPPPAEAGRNVRSSSSQQVSGSRSGGGGGSANRSASTSSASRSTGSTANRNVNTNTNVNRNVNSNTNVNRNVNIDNDVNIDRDVHVDVDVDDNWGCCHNDIDHPVGAAMAVGAAVAVTSAVIGSIVDLPPSCSQVIVNGFAYQQCGSTWYQPQMSGGSTTYVVVNQPN